MCRYRYWPPVGVSRAGRLQQLFPHERGEVRVELGRDVWRDERRERRAREVLADHRRPFDHGSFRGGQSIQPGGEERRDRRGDRHPQEVDRGDPPFPFLPQVAVVDQHRRGSPRRTAGCRSADVDDALACPGRAARRSRGGSATSASLSSLAQADRSRSDVAFNLPPPHARFGLEELRTRQAKEQHRRRPSPSRRCAR